MRTSEGNWWERQLSIGYQSPTTSGVPGGSVRTTCRDAPSLNHQWSDNGPLPKLQSSHTHSRRRSMSRHQVFEASSHFIQFFSLWQQIRWIRDYLGTNNSRRDVTNLSLILFITTTSGSVIGSSCRKKKRKKNTFLLFGHRARRQDDTMRHKSHVNWLSN